MHAPSGGATCAHRKEQLKDNEVWAFAEETILDKVKVFINVIKNHLLCYFTNHISPI
jgi:hypothetical protein